MQAELVQHESSVALPDGARVHPACPPDEQEECIEHESPRGLHGDAATSEDTDATPDSNHHHQPPAPPNAPSSAEPHPDGEVRESPPPPPPGWVWPREGDELEVEIEGVEEGDPPIWTRASVSLVLVDSWFRADIQPPGGADGWQDWFNWQEEGVDWRRAVPADNKASSGAGPAVSKNFVVGSTFVEDCGECPACLDKPKFGGPGTRKARCLRKPKTAERSTTTASGAAKRPAPNASKLKSAVTKTPKVDLDPAAAAAAAAYAATYATVFREALAAASNNVQAAKSDAAATAACSDATPPDGHTKEERDREATDSSDVHPEREEAADSNGQVMSDRVLATNAATEPPPPPPPPAPPALPARRGPRVKMVSDKRRVSLELRQRYGLSPGESWEAFAAAQNASASPSHPAALDGDQEFSVDCIVAAKGTGAARLYRVKWEGWEDPNDDTWEPIAHLHPKLVAEFEEEERARRAEEAAMARREAAAAAKEAAHLAAATKGRFVGAGGALPATSMHDLDPGTPVEVVMTEEGMAGSRYSAVVLEVRRADSATAQKHQHAKKKKKRSDESEALVEYDALFEGGDEGGDEGGEEGGDEGGEGDDQQNTHVPPVMKRLREWVPLSSLRPTPSKPGGAWARQLSAGKVKEAQLNYEGGWWDVFVVSRGNGGAASAACFTVEACGYGIRHTVSADKLRPRAE